MAESTKYTIESLPEFLNSSNLVALGLYPSKNAVYLARLRGKGPDFLKVGKKVIYPKKSIIEFINRHLKNGNIPQTEEDLVC